MHFHIIYSSLALLLYLSFHKSLADDVNEDLCGKVDLDGPVQAIQYKLESLYSGSDTETDATVAEIRSNFDDLTRKADRISDDCERKTPKLLGFINQMNQARQCIESLKNSNELEAQNECQAVHDEAKLNFVVRTVVNDTDDYAKVLKCANTFTDLVQRVKMYRAILREEDKGDKEQNKKFYDTVKQLIRKKNTPTNALRDILKNIAKKTVLDKNLKFTDLELIKDLQDYDDNLAQSAISELVSQVYKQNNFTANHLMYIPYTPSRITAIIALYNASKEHMNDNLAKKIYQIIYITRLRSDYKTVDVNSRKQIDSIYEKLPSARLNLKGFGVICVNTDEYNSTNTETDDSENDEISILIRSDTNGENEDDWKFKPNEKGTILMLNLAGDPKTKLFLSKEESTNTDVDVLNSEANKIGEWYKLTNDEICSIKDDSEQYVCSSHVEYDDKNIFEESSVNIRKRKNEARNKARETICKKP